MLEKDLERSLSIRVKAVGGICPKFFSPSYAGMPDRLVLLPGGRMAFVEVKRNGESSRPLQLSRHRLLQRLGFKVYVLDDVAKIGGILDDIQAP